MKTTLELPDDLLIEAKKRAAELRRPLRALVESALRAELEALARGPGGAGPVVEWVTVEGGLPEGLDASDRAALGDWMMREQSRP